jgi:hypothetical protein
LPQLSSRGTFNYIKLTFINCATMHSIEQPTLENFCSSKKHASYHITRSVSGMKSLLPLRLLSPSLPEIDVWPSNRSTFGMNIASNDEEEIEKSPEHLENEDLGTKLDGHRLKSYRDIPIYTEPGSPLLSRVYLTDDELHFSSTTSESDDSFEANDDAGVGIGGASECVGGPCSTKVNFLLFLETIIAVLMKPRATWTVRVRRTSRRPPTQRTTICNRQSVVRGCLFSAQVKQSHSFPMKLHGSEVR